MKTEISRKTYQQVKRFSGVYQQQGRILTDADWNELVDILKDNVNESFKDIIGNENGSMGGTPRHRALIIDKPGSIEPLTINQGMVFVDGMRGKPMPDPELFAPAAIPLSFEYTQQLDLPSAPSLISDCYIYADLWERSVTHLLDDDLRDIALHGADTCTRLQVMAQVKFCPKTILPESSSKNPKIGNALLSLTLLKKTAQPDPCDPCAQLVDVVTKTGNYLFRVEVHEVEGDADNPEAIVLKWSAENGAVQYALKDTSGGNVTPPPDFIAGNWLFEFFDQESEKHLGVHHAVPASWQPTVGNLIAKKYVLQGSAPNEFVRRWDGYCRLTRAGSSWSVDAEYDRAMNEAISFTSITGSTLTVSLDSHEIEVELASAFINGDYWLAEIRESAHQPGDKLLDQSQPCGIKHHYLMLGEITAGVLQDNPQAERKYAFPSLTEMTRTFIAGGDGQEIKPGDPLPEELRVGVANGEWPVVGATVRFVIDAGGGSLNILGSGLTNEEGVARCEWTPGVDINTNQRVKATLVDPNNGADPTEDIIPPLYFSAHLITADQVAYEPDCTDMTANTVHSRLVNDTAVTLELGGDEYYSVKEVLDALMCKLRAKHIPYDADNVSRWEDVNFEEGTDVPETVQEAIDALLENLQSENISYTPACDSDTPPTLRSLLNIPGNASSRVHEIFNKILCETTAAQIPVDRSDLCSKLESLTGDQRVDTVQDAINALCARESGGGCCQIMVKQGDDLAEKILSEIKGFDHVHICIESGEFNLKEPLRLSALKNVKFSGCTKGTLIRCTGFESAIMFSKCEDITVTHIRAITSTVGNDLTEETKHLNGTLSFNDVDNVNITSTVLQCGHGGARAASCITIAHSTQANKISIIDNQLNVGNQQVGILLVNVDNAVVENNQITVRPKPNNKALSQWVKNKGYRKSIRKNLITKPVIVNSDTPVDKKFNVEIAFEKRLLRFKTSTELTNAWSDVARVIAKEEGLSNLELINKVKTISDRIVLKLAGVEVEGFQLDIAPFKDWFEGFKIALPSIAAQGIVCAGVIANEILISNNVIKGFAQGVHIGLSHLSGLNDKDDPANYAGRLRLQCNNIINYESKLKGIEWHGIYIGNFKFLSIINNHLELQKYPENLDTRVEGIQVHGFFGDMLQIRENRLNNYSPGIYARALIDPPKAHLWQVENNLMLNAGRGVELIPQPQYITKDNID